MNSDDANVKKIQEKQAKIFDYIKSHFNLKIVKLYWSNLSSIRVIFPDEEEKMILYGSENEVVEIDLGKAPIMKCRDCGITFAIRGQSCNCPDDDKLFVDIDNMYYYIRVGGDIEKLVVVRDIQSNIDKSIKFKNRPRRKKLKDFIEEESEGS